MTGLPQREVEVFNAALALPAAERGAYLTGIGADDPDLQHRVEALLAAHERAAGFLEEPLTSLGVKWEVDPIDADVSGLVAGRYRVLELLGEGGCGRVYRAEQLEPVRRQVALKLIKLGMDTKSVIARFEAERQALALMDHPNIAKVFDAGSTASGRPFFVMELVEGLRITEYCDRQRLSAEARLDLFVHVCRAVQHAHQKGIIHRDLKPSNILVIAGDAGTAGVPKVIDFGIAKATQGRLTDQTLFTAFEQLLGTPAYMSPEQASLAGVDVDTRSDIYSLGVLLYELLTGQTPFDHQELLSAGVVAMRQIILEREPVRPSTRLRQLRAADLTTVAQSRRLQPPELIHSVRGDLDWIVLKCLHKDRQRRYETANGLALDVSRFLRNEPVLARPDSPAYRARKFVRRHRWAVAAGALLLLTMAAGLVGTMTQARRARRERDFALRHLSRAEAINDLNAFLIYDAAPSGKPFTASELLARAEQIVDRPTAESVENRIEMLVAVGSQYRFLEEHNRARVLLDKAYALSRQVTDPLIRAKAAAALGEVLGRAAEFERGEALVAEALAELEEGPEFVLTRIYCLRCASFLAREAGRLDLGLARILEAQRLARAASHVSVLAELAVAIDVAESYRMAGRLHEAAAGFDEAFQQVAALGRENTERAGTILNNWALVVSFLGRPREAEQMYRRAIAIASAEGSGDHVSPILLNNLARELHSLQQLPEAAEFAERAYRRAVDAGEELVVGQALSVRAHIYRDQGRLDLCAAALAELAPHWEGRFPTGHLALASLELHRALLAAKREAWSEALAAADRAVAMIPADGPHRDALGIYLLRRGEIRTRGGQLPAAAADLDTALAIQQAVAGPESASCWVGRVHLARARLLRAQGNDPAARAAFALARDQLRPTLGEEHPETREAAEGTAPGGSSPTASKP